MSDEELLAIPPGAELPPVTNITEKLLLTGSSVDQELLAIPPEAEIEPTSLNREMVKPIANIGEYATYAYQVGEQDVKEAFKYMEAVLGYKTYEQVEADLKTSRTVADQKNDAIKAYEDANFSDQWAIRFFQEAPRVGLQSAAFSGAVLAGGVAEGATLAGGSALAGAAFGPAASAGATGLGFATGFTAGSFSTSAILMQGLLYRDMRKAGITHDTATWLSYGGGIVQGLIEQLQLGQLMKFGKREVQAALKQVSTSTTGNALRGAKFLGEQAGEEAAQELTAKVAEAMGKWADLGVLPTVDEYWTAAGEILEAAKGGLQGGMAAGAAAKGVGATTKVSLTAAQKAAKLLTNPQGVTPEAFVNATMEVVAENRQPTRVEEKVKAELYKPVKPVELKATALSLDDVKKARTDAKAAFAEAKKKRQEFLDNNPDAELPESLQREYEAARFMLSDARADVKKLEYEIKKTEIEEKATDPNATAEQKQAVQEQIDNINEQLKNVKRNTALTTLKEQVAELDTELAENRKRILEGNVSTQLQDKVDRLQARKDDLEVTKWALENDAFTDKDLNAIRGTWYHGRQMSGIANFAVKRLVQAAKNASRAAVKDTRANQKMLKQLIDKSGVQNKDKAKFTKAILKGDLSAIEEIEEKINRIVEQRQQERVGESIQKLFDKPIKQEIDLQAQAGLTAYKAMYNAVAKQNEDPNKGLTVQDVMRFAAKADSEVSFNDAAEPGALSSALQRVIANDVLDTLTESYPVKVDLPKSKRMRALLAKLQTLYETGVEERAAELEQKQRQTEKDIVDARLGAAGFRIPNGLANIVVRWKRTGFIAKGYFSPWNVLHSMAFQHTPTDHPVWKLFDLSVESHNEAGNVQEQTEALLTAATQNDKAKLDLLAAGTIKKDRVTPGGKVWLKNVSDNELIQLHMQFADTTLRPGLEATGYTFKDSKAKDSTEALVEAELAKNPKLLEMAEGLKQFYKDYYNRINEHHIKEYGFPLARNAKYSGYVRRVLNANEEIAPYADLLDSLMERRSIVPDSVKTRMSRKPIELTDAFANAQNSIAQFEHWIAFSEKNRRLTAVLNDPIFRETVQNKYGDAYLTNLTKAFTHIIGTERPKPLSTYADKVLDMVHTNIAAFLGGNPLSYLKQRAGIFAFMAFIDPVTLKTGIDHYYDNFEDAQKVMAKSKFIKARMANSSPELRQVLNNTGKYYPGRFSFDKLRMMPVTLADLHTVKEGWWAVYQHATTTMRMPEQAAIEYADRIADSTQSSSLIEQRSLAELEGGKIGKLTTVFTKPSLQMSGIADNLQRRAMSDPLGKDAKTGVNNLIAAIQANIAFNASQVAFDAVGAAAQISTALLIHNGSDEADDRLDGALFNAAAIMAKAAALGPRIGLPLIGAGINAVVTDMSNWVKKDLGIKGKPGYSYQLSNAAMDALNDWADFTSAITDSSIGWGVVFSKQGGKLSGKQQDAVLGDVLYAWHLLNGASVLIPGGRALITTDAFVRYAKTVFPRDKDARKVEEEVKLIPVAPFDMATDEEAPPPETEDN